MASRHCDHGQQRPVAHRGGEVWWWRQLLPRLLVLSTLAPCGYRHAQASTAVEHLHSPEKVSQLFHPQVAAAQVAARAVEIMGDAASAEDLVDLLPAVIESSPLIYGSAIAFEPGLFTSNAGQVADDQALHAPGDTVDQRIYCPYGHQSPVVNPTSIITKDLALGYDYTAADWYVDPKRLFLRGVPPSHSSASCREEKRRFTKQSDHSSLRPSRPAPCFWTEVYFDAGGGDINMSTYSAVFRTAKNMSYLGPTYDGVPSKPDADGMWFGGVVTIDVKVEHIGELSCPADLCSSCPPGKEPSADQAGCVKCAEGTNTYSTYGICENCTGTAQKDSADLFTRCQDCPQVQRYSEREKRCVCQDGFYLDKRGTCEACDPDPAVVTCPGGGHRIPGVNRSAVLPQPGHWIEQSVVERVTNANGIIGLEDMMKKRLWCDEKICVGTRLDRDWNETSPGEFEFVGHCQGDYRLEPTEVQVSCEVSNPSGAKCPSVQPPEFCRAGHTGRLCGACINGTRKADSICCTDAESSLAQWALHGKAVLTQVVYLITLVVYFVLQSQRITAADTAMSSAIFLLQTMKLVGRENGWLAGVAGLQEAVNFVSSLVSLESNYWNVETDDVCAIPTCPSFLDGLDSPMRKLAHKTVEVFLLVLLTYGLTMNTHRISAATCGRVTVDLAETRADRWNWFHRGLLGIYLFTFTLYSQAALDVIIARCYSADPDGDCDWLSLPARIMHSTVGSDDVEPVMLLKADPGILYLGTIGHRVAFIWAFCVLLLYVVAMPLYIWQGIYKERQHTQVLTVQTSLEKAKNAFKHAAKSSRSGGQSSPSPTDAPPSQHDAAEQVLHVRGIGVDGWDGTVDGRGTFEYEEPLKNFFVQKFGPVVNVTVRHRIANGANTSWALVTMETAEGAEAALAAPFVMAGTNELIVTRYDRKVAKISRGGMALIKEKADLATGMMLSRDYDNKIRERAASLMTARSHVLHKSNLRFSPMYGTYSEGVMSWWFMADIVKRFTLLLFFTVGEDDEDSHWKTQVFILMGVYVILEGVHNPFPTMRSDFFEATTCVIIMVVLHTSSISDLEEALHTFVATIVVVMVSAMIVVQRQTLGVAGAKLRDWCCSQADDKPQTVRTDSERQEYRERREGTTGARHAYAAMGTDADESFEVGAESSEGPSPVSDNTRLLAPPHVDDLASSPAGDVLVSIDAISPPPALVQSASNSRSSNGSGRSSGRSSARSSARRSPLPTKSPTGR
jgi:hypothetical protein